MNHYCSEKTGVRRSGLLSSSPRKLLLLAPSTTAIPVSFSNVDSDSTRYNRLLESMQRMRGAVYLEDGAIRDFHLTDGRHKQAADYVSWHLLVLDQSDRVCGCARYREYLSNTQYSELSVSRSALAHCSNWGSPLRSSVDAELELSREMSLPYVELGG